MLTQQQNKSIIVAMSTKRSKEMKRVKKTIISNTITFILITLFVSLFSKVFGNENSIVGVCTVIIGLCIVEKDLTQNPLRRFFWILILNIILGIGSYVVMQNAFIGIIINFILIFGIVYNTVDIYKKPLYYPFILSYLFMMLTSPATLQGLPKRLISLSVGSIFVILLQLLFNGKKFEKTLTEKRKLIIEGLVSQIESSVNGKYDEHKEKQLRQDINTLIKCIYDKREKNKILSDNSKINLNIILSLEKLAILVEVIVKHKKIDKYKGLLSVTKQSLERLNKSLNGKEIVKYETLDVEYYENDDISKQLIQIFKSIKINVEDLSCSKEKINKDSDLLIKNIIKKVNIHSFSFKFSLKLSITLSIGIFLTTIFKLPYGKWLTFTILALIQPYYEKCTKKVKERIVGTAIGVVVFAMLFTIFKDNTARIIIVLLTSYINMYVKRYDYQMIFITIQGIGGAVTAGAHMGVALDRLVFVMLGVIISIIVNRFIFKYEVEDSMEELYNIYEQCAFKISNMIEQENKGYNDVYNLLLEIKLIENVLIENSIEENLDLYKKISSIRNKVLFNIDNCFKSVKV